MNNKIKTGLSNKEVFQNRLKYGNNALNYKNKNGFFRLILESFSDPIIKILLLALAIKIIFLFKDSNVYETLGIVIAICLATFVSALSEYGSEKAFEKLCEENSIIKVKVIRNSKKVIINIDEIVYGDIVCLESGDKVPADGKIIQGQIYVDESSLTGESYEKCKGLNDTIYMGSIVTEKSAMMEVTCVGEKTFYGKIANDIQEKTIESPLKTRLRDLAKDISKFGYFAAVLVLISYMYNALIVVNDFDLNKILTFKNFFPHLIYGVTLSVAVIVMAVPEGLPMMITLVLSSNMKRMINKNVLVRKLVGIETSGSLNILFTDKTGTLTEGKLSVTSFMTPEFKNYKSIEQINKNNSLRDIINLSLVYNNSSFFTGNKIEGGNSTERAILSFYKNDDRSRFKIIDSKEFDSTNKYSWIDTNYNGKTVFFKGAYELILNKSLWYLTDTGKKRVLINKEKIQKYIESEMLKGKRVLAIAMSNSTNFDSLCLIGFVFLKDNIRKETVSAIRAIKSSGIQVVMVTGDSKQTAMAIARETKILDGPTDIVLTSEEFNKMTDEYLMNILPNLKVLSRALPQDKNRLVKISQAKGLIVGMTGDGVNDASALKKADVGFSLGSGTEVAKETSDIVILDDNIASITTAILYGRTIFKSIRKFVIFQLTVNVSAVLLSVIGPFIGVLSPVTVVQMLWINMVMDTLAGLAFAFEPALKEYMYEKPKNRNEKIINKYMKNQIILNSAYSCAISIFFLKSSFIKSIYRYDPNNKYLMTAFFGLFIFLAIFNAVNARTYRINTFANLFKNRVFIFVLLFIAVVQIILIYYGGDIFRATGLTKYEFEIMLLLAFTVIPFDFIRKIILKKRNIVREI
mgnify:FL=1